MYQLHRIIAYLFVPNLENKPFDGFTGPGWKRDDNVSWKYFDGKSNQTAFYQEPVASFCADGAKSN